MGAEAYVEHKVILVPLLDENAWNICELGDVHIPFDDQHVKLRVRYLRGYLWLVCPLGCERQGTKR